MKKLMIIPGLYVCLSIGIFIFGCGTPAHRQIFKEDLSYTQQVYAYPQQILFRAVINSVLSAGFAIEREDGATQFVLAKRSFQEGKKCTVVVLQIKIAQLAAQKAIVYLNALETTERLFIADRTRFFLFVIPLPGGGGKEASQVKIGETQIKDKEFYQEFFKRIDKECALLIEAISAENTSAKPESSDPVRIDVQKKILAPVPSQKKDDTPGAESTTGQMPNNP